MKKINKFLFLMLSFGAAACFVACGSDSNSEDEIQEVALSQKSMNLILHEESGLLTASPLVEGYSTEDIVWTNSNPSVAEYDPTTGVVTAKEVGKTTLSARLKGRSVVSNCYVTVTYVKVEELTLDKTEISLRGVETATIVATILPENACYKDVEWASSDETLVKVKNGVITSNPDKDPTKIELAKSGIVEITATSVDQKKTAKCMVYVGQFSGLNYPTYPEKQQW